MKETKGLPIFVKKEKIIRNFEMFPERSICIELNKQVSTPEQLKQFLEEMEEHMERDEK